MPNVNIKKDAGCVIAGNAIFHGPVVFRDKVIAHSQSGNGVVVGPSGADFRVQCMPVADGTKPCMRDAPAQPLRPELQGLAIQAEDEMHDLHASLRAYEVVQSLVAHVPGNAMPPPRDMGALLQTLNDGTAARLTALEATLSAMRAAV